MENNNNKIKYYTIGEVSDLLNTRESTLRYWQKEFEQLNPQRTDSNRRIYTEDDIKVIKKIMHLLLDLKYTIAGAKEELAKDDELNSLSKNNDESKNSESSNNNEKINKKPDSKNSQEIKKELKNILDILNLDNESN